MIATNFFRVIAEIDLFAPWWWDGVVWCFDCQEANPAVLVNKWLLSFSGQIFSVSLLLQCDWSTSHISTAHLLLILVQSTLEEQISRIFNTVITPCRGGGYWKDCQIQVNTGFPALPCLWFCDYDVFVGLFFILPCIDSYQKVDLRTVSFDVPPQEVLTNLGYVYFSFMSLQAAFCGSLDNKQVALFIFRFWPKTAWLWQ